MPITLIVLIILIMARWFMLVPSPRLPLIIDFLSLNFFLITHP